jgi:hypothetical protein
LSSKRKENKFKKFLKEITNFFRMLQFIVTAAAAAAAAAAKTINNQAIQPFAHHFKHFIRICQT